MDGEISMAEDWLYKQMKQAQNDVKQWPSWMKKSYGIKDDDMIEKLAEAIHNIRDTHPSWGSVSECTWEELHPKTKVIEIDITTKALKSLGLKLVNKDCNQSDNY
jgi:hypothetical protein